VQLPESITISLCGQWLIYKCHLQRRPCMYVVFRGRRLYRNYTMWKDRTESCGTPVFISGVLDNFLSTHNTNETGWETFAQCRRIARICALFKAYTGRRAWRAMGDRLLKPCYLSRVDHNRQIRTRKQRTDVGKYSLVNRTIQSWNQLPAGLLASFSCSLSTFRKRGRQLTRKWGLSAHK
jgi:hypothetical protein